METITTSSLPSQRGGWAQSLSPLDLAVTPERLWYQRQGHRQFVCEGSVVVVVTLPGLWGLALQLLDSTLLRCNMFPKVARSR